MADVGINPSAWTDPRMMLANQLMQQSTETGPLQSWTQVLARALSGPLGAYEATKYRDETGKLYDEVYSGATGGLQPGTAQPTGAQGGGAPSQPGLFQRIGNFFTGDSSQPSGATTSGNPGSAPTGPQTTGTPSAAAPSSGASSGVTSGAPSPVPSPAQAQAGQAPAPQTQQIPGPVAQMIWNARRMMQVGRENNRPDLIAQGGALLQNIQQKLAEAQITAQGKILEGGKILSPDGQSVTEVGNWGNIDATNAAKKDQAENPALIARATGIAAGENPYKIAQALAPKQFDLATGTQMYALPGGPRLMTGQQAMDYARSTGTMPGVQPPATPASGAPQAAGGAVTGAPTANAPADGSAAPSLPGGALQDPKVRDAQISEVTKSQQRLADAQTRLQNLGQLKQILANPGLITGAQGDEIQAIRGTMLQAYNQLGVKPPDDLRSGVANAEALKAAATNLAIEVSRDEGVGTPRVSIMNAITANKPSLTTSPQGNIVKVLAMEQEARREADFGNFAPGYYQLPGNYNKQNAEAAFAKIHPVSEYTSQIYPQNADDYAKIPVGQMYLSPDGTVHTKAPPVQAPQ